MKGGRYIFVAKEVLNQTPHEQLVSDFERGLKYLRAVVN